MNKELYNYINESYFKQTKIPIFEHFLKPELIKLEEGYAEVTMKVREDELNLHGIIHGGILASLADLTMGTACLSFYKSIVTTEMSLSFIRSVSEGSIITAKATVDNNGNNLMRTTCNIYNEEGKLLLKAIATFFILGPLDLKR